MAWMINIIEKRVYFGSFNNAVLNVVVLFRNLTSSSPSVIHVAFLPYFILSYLKAFTNVLSNLIYNVLLTTDVPRVLFYCILLATICIVVTSINVLQMRRIASVSCLAIPRAGINISITLFRSNI
jgi:hypothetical protein